MRKELLLLLLLLALLASLLGYSCRPRRAAQPRAFETNIVVYGTVSAYNFVLLTNSPALDYPKYWDAESGLTGVPGDIPSVNATNIVEVTGLDPTGTNDCTAALQALLNKQYPVLTALRLPPGRFRFNKNLLLLKNNIVLLGSGMTNTVLVPYDTTGSFFCQIGSSYLGATRSIVSPVASGMSNITVASKADLYTGTLAYINAGNTTDQYATNNFMISVYGYNGIQGQVVWITGIESGTNVTFWPPLYDSWTNRWPLNFTPLVGAWQNIGIENLGIDMKNGTHVAGIFFNGTKGCWARNVFIIEAQSFNILVQWSLNGALRHNRISDRRKDVGPNGAGIILEHCWNWLVEDNIIIRQFPGVEMNFGSGGNVVAYNYAEDSCSQGQDGVCYDSNHGPHNQYNLYEGNIGPNFGADGYYGSCADDWVYRNWFTGYQTTNIAGINAINLKRFTRGYKLIGNNFGSDGKRSTVYFGQPNIGNFGSAGTFAPPWKDWGTKVGPNGFQETDTNVAATTQLLLNFYAGSNGIPASQLSPGTLPASLYRKTKPAWMGICELGAAGEPIPRTISSLTNQTAINPAQACRFGIAYLKDQWGRLVVVEDPEPDNPL